MRKIIRISSIIILISFFLTLLFFTNAFFGNPISKIVAIHNAEEYIEKNYDKDLLIENTLYDFKDGRYHVFVKSNNSMDTHFTISYNQFGKFISDDYERRVTNKYNTFNRINNDYREKVDKALEKLPYNINIDYGEFGSIDDTNNLINFGVDINTLILDKEYNLNELGSSYGRLIIYVNDEVTVEKASSILLKIKEVFDEEDTTFHAVNLYLLDKKDLEEKKCDNYISLDSFLYSNINENNLIEKVEDSINETKKYYDQLEKNGK